MANWCNYTMKAVSKSKDSLNRLFDIMSYKDPEHYMYEVIQVNNLTGIIEDGEYFYVELEGYVAWSCDAWVFQKSDVNDLLCIGHEKDENGKPIYNKPIYGTAYFTSLPDICKKFDITVQLYGAEPDMEFQLMIHINKNGIINHCDCAYTFDDHYEPLEAMDGYGNFENCDVIYNGEITNEVTIKEKE